MNKVLLTAIIFLCISLVSCDKKTGVYHSITGSWRCQEYNPIDGQRIYLVDIDRSKQDTTQYLLSNFHNQDINEFVYAQLIDSTLSIFQQTFASLVVKSGTGKVSKDFSLIEFNYEIFDGQDDIKSHAVYTRPN